jgi:hypothetical protein
VAARDPSEQERAALEIILRGGEEVRGVVGTFAGEDAAFVVRVTEEPGTGDVRVWPLAILLQDEHLPFIGGPPDAQSEPDAPSEPEARPLDREAAGQEPPAPVS